MLIILSEDSLPKESTESKEELAKGSVREEPAPSKSPAALEEVANIFWVKDKDSPAHELPSDSSSVPYSDLKTKAIQERREAATGTCPHDMVVLYQFWSHFLVRNFNTTMYNDFRNLALADKDHGSEQGLAHLVKFYDACIYSPNTQIRARVASHYIDLAKTNSDIGFDSLRRGWRDGTIPLKNRKVLLRFLDPELKASMESAPVSNGHTTSPSPSKS